MVGLNFADDDEADKFAAAVNAKIQERQVKTHRRNSKCQYLCLVEEINMYVPLSVERHTCIYWALNGRRHNYSGDASTNQNAV